MSREPPTSTEPRLVPATDEHMAELMTWFRDPESTALWGGPDFRFPFTDASFREDAHWGRMPMLALVGPDDELLAFGQFYLRAGRCQLARLAVSPARRGRGLGTLLIRKIASEGCRRLAVDECSLFVATANEPAARLYRRLGFAEAPLPESETAVDGAVYMTAPLTVLVDSEA